MRLTSLNDIMPTVTCPYCKQQNPSKYLHKKHLRDVHPTLHNNNIQTCFTGCQHECVPIADTKLTSTPDIVTVDNGKPDSPLSQSNILVSGTYEGLPFVTIDSVSRADEVSGRVLAFCKINGIDVVLSFSAELVMLK